MNSLDGKDFYATANSMFRSGGLGAQDGDWFAREGWMGGDVGGARPVRTWTAGTDYQRTD